MMRVRSTSKKLLTWELGESLQPGKSIIIVDVEDRWSGDSEARLKTDGASVVTEPLKEDLVEQLRES
jgi:hypothetical protein